MEWVPFQPSAALTQYKYVTRGHTYTPLVDPFTDLPPLFAKPCPSIQAFTAERFPLRGISLHFIL